MDEHARSLAESTDENSVLKAILEGTASETGDRFFEAMVRNLAQALGTDSAWVTEYSEDRYRFRAIAFWHRDDFIKDYQYSVANTPCERLVEKKELVHYADQLQSLFPGDPNLPSLHATSYMGFPLLDEKGNVLGHLAVMDSRPMPYQPRLEQLFRIFAARAGAELRRLRAEAGVAEREARLSRIIDSAMDAIIDLDHRLRITGLNEAARRTLNSHGDKLLSGDFKRLLVEESASKLGRLTEDLLANRQERNYLRITGGLKVVPLEGEPFPAEASLFRYELDGDNYFTLIIRCPSAPAETEAAFRRPLTIAEFHQFERENIIRALDLCGWKVAGAKGAAALMEVPPSTLSSRMKALKIHRPG